MFKLHKYSCKKCIPALIIILFFIGLLPPNLYGQVKIKERVELQNTKGVESFIWPVNGCEYDTFDSSRIFVKFEPNPVSPGNITIASLWLDENFTWQYWPDGEPLLLRTFELDPDYGECVRIGDGLYRISIPDTVTTDSVAVAFNYINFRHFCAGKGSELVLDDKDCLSCFPYWRALSKGYTQDTLIIKPDSFVVYIEPEECYPGDTVQVVIKKRLSDGTLVDFPATQTYEIAKLEGCMLGNILADNDSGSYFYDVSQPIYFAAADTLVGDTTGTVLLQVGLVDPAKKKEFPLNHPTHNESNDCFTGSFQTDAIKDIMFNVKEIKIVIFTPQPFVDDYITVLPSMPTVICTATLNKSIQGTIKYEWKYIVRQYYQRKNYPNCTRFSQSEFQGVSYSTNGGYTQWTVPFIKDSGYYWFEAVGYKDEDPLEGCSKIFTNWYDSNPSIFTGGDVFISVTAEDRFGKIFAEIVELPLNRLLGLNPEKEFARNYANDDEISAIMESESETHQFTYNPLAKNFPYGYGKLNYPEYGYPNGFGIMKVDNPTATERELWNWKANIDKGKFIYGTKKQNAIDYLNTYTTSYPDSIRIQESFQRYNGGHLYVYNKKTEKWKIRDGIKEDREEATYNTGREVITKYCYGIYTWRRYQDIINRKAKS